MKRPVQNLAKKNKSPYNEPAKVNHMDSIAAEIFKLVKKKVVEQGAYDRSSYDEIVEETIQYFREKGRLTDEDSDEFIKDQLTEMLEILKDEIAEE